MADSKVPDIFSEYESAEVLFEGAVNEEILLKMAGNNNFLLDLMPIGSVIYFNDNLNGAGAPDSNYWQYCDGSEITNPNSPIRSIGIFQSFCPDLRDNYPRGANDEISNSTGGAASINASHTHGIGVAGGGGAGMDEETKGPGDRYHQGPHTHGLTGSLGVIELEPKHINLNAYMKVV